MRHFLAVDLESPSEIEGPMGTFFYPLYIADAHLKPLADNCKLSMLVVYK